ncbi:acyltransferase family protein [Nonomuraea sp. NPDC049269]|uniref:acyltransferase family protein n=1 Tax=Nonomuraea sp. NPDC049269 TaxID=3364349 RepID=UPI0037144D7D
MTTSHLEAPQVVQPALPRLAWLDALRGIGALAVVGEHLMTWAMPWLRPISFNLGMYGVLVFFLVSGYVIPISLERHGDVRAFWIGRLFRLYPLYLAVVGLVLALSWWIPVRAEVPRDPSSVAAHATMLMDVVGAGAVVNTMWTLSYEMVFYLLVAALFVTGNRGGRGLLAVAFGLAAVITGLALSSTPLAGGWLAWVSFAVFAVGLVCVISGRMRTAACCALGMMALALLLLSSRVPWFGAAMLAVMFIGTAIHRWERGQGGLWPVALAASLVTLSPFWAINAGWWWVRPQVWALTIALAALTFAGGMAWRRRRVPYVLTWLGVISYSLYLTHLPILTLVIQVVGEMRWSPWPMQIGIGLFVMGVVLPGSWLTYRFLEQPMQRLGRRLARAR